MNEKRQYKRYSCTMKIRFSYFEGDPDTIDISSVPTHKGKGLVLDISRGGMMIATDSRVSVNMPLTLEFRTKSSTYNLSATIVRTGLLNNNPSVVARRFANAGVGKSAFIAIQFNPSLSELDENDLLSL